MLITINSSLFGMSSYVAVWLVEGDIGVSGFAVLALFYLSFSEFEILKLGFAVFNSTAICGC